MTLGARDKRGNRSARRGGAGQPVVDGQTQPVARDGRHRDGPPPPVGGAQHVEEPRGGFRQVARGRQGQVARNGAEADQRLTRPRLLGVQPDECVYLDDLGINLKPAKAMGMQTIKVVGAEQAISDLEGILGIPLR